MALYRSAKGIHGATETKESGTIQITNSVDAVRFSQRVNAHPLVLKKRALAFDDLLKELQATASVCYFMLYCNILSIIVI